MRYIRVVLLDGVVRSPLMLALLAVCAYFIPSLGLPFWQMLVGLVLTVLPLVYFVIRVTLRVCRGDDEIITDDEFNR